MEINKLKRPGIIIGSVIVSLYLIFLLLPLILSPILNSYNVQVQNLIEEATGYKVKLGKLGVVTTPKLTAGIKIKHADFMIPTGEKFLAADNLRAKLSLLPFLVGKIEVDSVSVDYVSADLQIRQDGKFLIEEFLPQPDPDKQIEAAKPLPLGLKLSNKLPDIVIKEYDASFIDMASKSEYTLSGQNLRLTDFILDKKFKFSVKGNLTLNSEERFNYDIKLDNRIMPDISLNDLVFNSEPQEQKTEQDTVFNIIDLFKALDKNKLTANLAVNLKTSGAFNSPIVKGFANIDKVTLFVDDKKLPESNINFNARGKNLKLDMNLFSAENEKTVLSGKFKTGKRPNIDMQFISNAQFNNIFKIINSIAKSFNYNELETLTATGGIDADFNIQSNMKYVKSSGYIKIPQANINYKLYNIAINKIKADVDLNDMLNIQEAGFEIMGHPLKVYGTIRHNSNTDLHLSADKLLLKGLAAALGQVQLLKENRFSSGCLSLNASLSGKLSKLIPVVNLSVDNVDIKNIPTNTKIAMPCAKLVINTDGKKFNGNLTVEDLKITNPSAVVSLPETEIVIGDKDIDIKKAYVLLNNSRIDITGHIANYINDKLKIEINAKGDILSNDIKSMLPKDMRSMISAAGKLPLDISVIGNKKVQDIKVNLKALPDNYISFCDINALRGKTTLINTDIRIADDSAKLADTGIFADNLNNAVVSLEGAINNLSKHQKLNLRLSVPKKITMSVPGFRNSSLDVRGDIDILGNLSNPYLNGLVSIPVISLPDLALNIKKLVVNLNGPVLKGNATIQNVQSGGIIADNLAAEFLLKNYSVFYINNFVGDAFNGKISGNISYGLNDGKITVNMTGSDMNALKTVEGVAGIKNALSGTLGFKANIMTKGVTDVDFMKNLSGVVTFGIDNGKFLNIGRLDSLLYAENVLGNAILKTAVTSVASLPLIQNTAEFKNINGELNFLNGWANIDYIKTSGPLMAYYINGRYNLLNATTNVVILGRLDEKVVALLGPLGELSVDKLTSYLPKFGTLTSILIDSMTTNPEKENTSNIPSLSSGSLNYKDFKVEFNGGIESKSSVKSFKWLSKCDTSAIDIKQELNSTAEMLKNTVEDTKQQLLDAKEGLKNLFKF